MADTPTTSNPAADLVNSAIAKAVAAAEGPAELAVETALDTNVPFFALPVVHEVSDAIIRELVSKLGDQVSIELQKVGTFVIIDTQVAGEKTGVSDALAALMLAEKSGDPNAIKAAIQAYANSQSALVHDDGSSPPVSS